MSDKSKKYVDYCPTMWYYSGGGKVPGKDGKKMKIEISNEDFESISLAIAIAKNLVADSEKDFYTNLNKRFVDSYMKALDDEVYSRFDGKSLM